MLSYQKSRKTLNIRYDIFPGYYWESLSGTAMEFQCSHMLLVSGTYLNISRDLLPEAWQHQNRFACAQIFDSTGCWTEVTVTVLSRLKKWLGNRRRGRLTVSQSVPRTVSSCAPEPRGSNSKSSEAILNPVKVPITLNTEQDSYFVLLLLLTGINYTFNIACTPEECSERQRCWQRSCLCWWTFLCCSRLKYWQLLQILADRNPLQPS